MMLLDIHHKYPGLIRITYEDIKKVKWDIFSASRYPIQKSHKPFAKNIQRSPRKIPRSGDFSAKKFAIKEFEFSLEITSGGIGFAISNFLLKTCAIVMFSFSDQLNISRSVHATSVHQVQIKPFLADFGPPIFKNPVEKAQGTS